jgi:hypothetical protein
MLVRGTRASVPTEGEGGWGVRSAESGSASESRASTPPPGHSVPASPVEGDRLVLPRITGEGRPEVRRATSSRPKEDQAAAAPPRLEASLPRLEASAPGLEAPLPRTGAPLPHLEAALPHLEAAPPGFARPRQAPAPSLRGLERPRLHQEEEPRPTLGPLTQAAARRVVGPSGEAPRAAVLPSPDGALPSPAPASPAPASPAGRPAEPSAPIPILGRRPPPPSEPGPPSARAMSPLLPAPAAPAPAAAPREPPPPPAIRVTIGRVEIRALAAPSPARRPAPRPPPPRLSLDEYLERRR